MVVFISGSVNSGKSTTSKLIAEKLGAERVDVDEIVSIPNFDLSKDIPEAIQQSIKHINNLTDNGKNVIANYVLRQQDYEQLSSGLTDPNQHYFTLAPNLQIALSNRGRGMNSWEYERIKYHYDTGIANPKFGTIIDTSNMSIETVANKIILYINKKNKLCLICILKDMPLIYITGPTGSGKSTICSELKAKGYETYDTDNEGMRKIINHNGTELLALNLDKLETLKNNSTHKTIFICGTSANDLENPDLFSKIFLLVINEKTQLKRILNRTNNQYGKQPHQLANALKWRDVQIEKYRQAGAIEIDASWPLDEIISKLLSLV